MPTWSSIQAFEADVARFQQELERETRRAAGIDMAQKAQGIAERAASADLGGDPKFSGWAPTLSTQVKALPSGALIHPTRTSAGPWTVAEFGRNTLSGPGLNARGRTSRRRDGSVIIRSRRGGKRWNGITQGKGTASRAVDEMDRELAEIPERHVRKALVKRFDVS